MNNSIKTGSVWKNFNGSLYKVSAVARTKDETWVVYSQLGNQKKTQSCLDHDFLRKFKEHTTL
jgi:hypothetical protein